jgi:hypothetical protein
MEEPWIPISLMHVHGSLPGQVQSYTWCMDIDRDDVRLELLAALNRDFVAPEGVEWGTYAPKYEETFAASPITQENIEAINEQLIEIVLAVSLPHVPADRADRLRSIVREEYAAAGTDGPGRHDLPPDAPWSVRPA